MRRGLLFFIFSVIFEKTFKEKYSSVPLINIEANFLNYFNMENFKQRKKITV